MANHESPRYLSTNDKKSYLNLQVEREKQATKMIDLGFHTAIGLSANQYIETLPDISSQPEGNQFTIPLLIDPRIQLEEQYELTGIKSNRFDIKNIVTIPDEPYAIWTHDGTRNRSLSINEARTRFAEDEEGSPLIEAVALYIHKPEIFKEYSVTAPGSRISGAFEVFYPDLSATGGAARVTALHESTKFSTTESSGALSRKKLDKK